MRLIRQIFLPLVAALAAPAQNTPAPALTIYNQDFAVVRQQVRLDLKSGVNNVRFDGTTAQLEPDSVVLRDPNGKRTLQILEQNYQADPVSQQSLLELFEGKTIDFQVTRGDKIDTVPGRIVRPGSACYQRTTQGCAPEEPLIEIGGKLQFGLPGRPLFPALPQDTNLKPTLDWILDADGGGPLDAELSYVTSGMTWEADYNIIAPPSGDVLDLVGWVTMENRTGKTFDNARIKLMAGDVSKIRPRLPVMSAAIGVGTGYGGGVGSGPPVTEKAFDEYHLYSLERPATLRDRETKQVEFVHAAGFHAKRIYVYDGGRIDPSRYQSGNWEYIANAARFWYLWPRAEHQDHGDAGIQELRAEPPRHALAQRPPSFLPARPRRCPAIHRREGHRPHHARRNLLCLQRQCFRSSRLTPSRLMPLRPAAGMGGRPYGPGHLRRACTIGTLPWWANV